MSTILIFLAHKLYCLFHFTQICNQWNLCEISKIRISGVRTFANFRISFTKKKK